MSIKKINLPWVEKYRPKKLEDLKSQTDILNTINKSINNRNFPHLLLYGPPGSGKTTCALAICLKLYGKKMMNSRILELNASDERGIKIVRDKIKTYASLALSIPPKGYKYPCPKFKIIILDEADAMTTDSQFALRRIIEKYSDSTRFILTCNYISKIISPILSRCIGFKFRAIDETNGLNILDRIIKEENVKINKESIKEIYKLCSGDMRLSINLLQKLTYCEEKITSEIVRENYGIIPYKLINKILEKLKSDNSSEIIINLAKILMNRGFSSKLIIESFTLYFKNFKVLDDNKLCLFFSKISDIDHFLNLSGNQFISTVSILKYLAILVKN